ncbi:MAG: permease prefix domain 1-containing protein, partial [Longimicrobiales bacterium]
MSWMDGLSQRARMVFRRRVMERELEDELRFHREREVESDLARGAAAGEARRAALRFGGEDRIREQVRDEWASSLLLGFWQDVRQGVRRLVQRPGFTVTALLTLGLGIGANTVVF